MHRLAKAERKVLEMTSVDKDGSTDEIAIDETRLLQSRKAFARRQREESDVCHRQTAGKETDKEGAGYEGYG